jgi:hypothetical protein
VSDTMLTDLAINLVEKHTDLLERRLVKLTAENAALRADKERLDWLEGWGTEFALTLFGPVITRDAIDAAKGGAR